MSGFTFWGSDWLGRRLGMDMSDDAYLSAKDAEGLGNVARAAGFASEFGGNMPREQVTRIPKTIKGKPVETTDFGQDIYMYKAQDGNYRVVTSSTPKGKSISSIIKLRGKKIEGKFPSFQSSFPLVMPEKDTQ